MKVAVMGAGAVGCYYGFLLARAGHAVTLIGRPALVEAVDKAGLVLESAAGTASVPVRATDAGAGVTGADLVLAIDREHHQPDAPLAIIGDRLGDGRSLSHAAELDGGERALPLHQ